MSEHKCPTCGKSTDDLGHLCTPQELCNAKCDWCGSVIVDARHLCSDKAEEISYICNSCGRTAISADQLCKPEKIK